MTTPYPGPGEDPGQQPGPGPSSYPPGPPRPPADSNTLSIVGIVLGAIGILFCPIAIGVAGIICAAIARSKGERLATVALAVAIGGTLLGFVLGFAVNQTLAPRL